MARAAIQSRSAPADRARILAEKLRRDADLLGDPSLEEARRTELAALINRIWEFTFFGATEDTQTSDTLVLVGAIQAAASEHRAHPETLPCTLVLHYLDMRIPHRLERFDREGIVLLHTAISRWHARGRNAGKWESIARVAESIGIRRSGAEIETLWREAQASRRLRKKGG